METTLWILAAALSFFFVLSLYLSLRLHAIHRAAGEISRELTRILRTDTNNLITLSTSDRALKKLAALLNTELAALRKERRRLQSGDRELKEAITGVAHDLRTPLTAIRGYLSLLEEEEHSPNSSRYLSVVRERTDALTSLTEELFRYSVVVSSAKELRPEKLSLNGALEESMAGYYAALTQKKISPAIALPDAPVYRFLDRAALGRIFENILNNAVKYSDGDLCVTLTEAGEISFSNRAEKLNALAAEKLFDRFYTVESGQNATGLGLSIARLLTEEMGGKIFASYENRTLTIRLFFPD